MAYFSKRHEMSMRDRETIFGHRNDSFRDFSIMDRVSDYYLPQNEECRNQMANSIERHIGLQPRNRPHCIVDTLKGNLRPVCHHGALATPWN